MARNAHSVYFSLLIMVKCLELPKCQCNLNFGHETCERQSRFGWRRIDPDSVERVPSRSACVTIFFGCAPKFDTRQHYQRLADAHHRKGLWVHRLFLSRLFTCPKRLTWYISTLLVRLISSSPCGCWLTSETFQLLYRLMTRPQRLGFGLMRN